MSDFLPKSGKCRGLFDLFVEKFPMYKEQVKLYGPIDRRSIKVTLNDHSILVFVYVDMYDWGLQTYQNYLNSMKTRQDGDALRAIRV